MKEILGRDLKKFFDAIDPNYIHADITYAGDMYEVWEVSDELFDKMNSMSEEEFVELAGEDAFWRYSDGSVLGATDTTVYIQDNEMLGWRNESRDLDCDDDDYCDPEERCEETCRECMRNRFTFSSLLEYLCDEVGCSQPKNVCACAMDLAKANHMSMGALFEKYEGKNKKTN